MILQKDTGIEDEALLAALTEEVEKRMPLSRVLLLPPDFTRMYSYAGKITAMLYRLLDGKCEIDVMPALGTHRPMTKEECEAFFEGTVPYDKLIAHDWRHDVTKLGEVPGAFVFEVSEGICTDSIDVEVNRRIIDPGYDLVISIGQVVPHEVVGMANYSKNIFVGCGGSSMINASHALGAFYGMERIMGRDHSPVRQVFDYAEEHFLANVPLLYIMTCTTNRGDDVTLHGLFIGRERENFEAAVAQSQEKNLTHEKKALSKVVVYLDPREFQSTWLGNKAIYRTRMAIADNGELIILAPGVERFGEDAECDRLIRKYGYCGREKVLALSRESEELQNNLSVAAHLIHGSSDGRFHITYCTEKVTEAEVRGVCFDYMPYDEAVKKYDPAKLKDGFNTVDGEEIFYISNPALGLWIADGDKKGDNK